MRIQIPTDRHQRDSNPRHSNVDIQICRNIDALNHCATAAIAATQIGQNVLWNPHEHFLNIVFEIQPNILTTVKPLNSGHLRD